MKAFPRIPMDYYVIIKDNYEERVSIIHALIKKGYSIRECLTLTRYLEIAKSVTLIMVTVNKTGDRGIIDLSGRGWLSQIEKEGKVLQVENVNQIPDFV